MEFGLTDDAEDGEYNGISFVYISNRTAMKGRFFVESMPSDRI